MRAAGARGKHQPTFLRGHVGSSRSMRALPLSFSALFCTWGKWVCTPAGRGHPRGLHGSASWPQTPPGACRELQSSCKPQHLHSFLQGPGRADASLASVPHAATRGRQLQTSATCTAGTWLGGCLPRAYSPCDHQRAPGTPSAPSPLLSIVRRLPPRSEEGRVLPVPQLLHHSPPLFSLTLPLTPRPCPCPAEKIGVGGCDSGCRWS